MSYNPFNKGVGDSITFEDLNLLVTRQVSEGFFVEFKRELPKDRDKIAKSIASFANTYGGWYLVGVDAPEHNVAKEIVGFDAIGGDHDPVAVVTEIVKVGIDPIPTFHAQTVVLENQRLVLAVYVPHGQDTPYLTRDGRLYRRTHDSSSPLSANSRHELDVLVSRGERYREIFKEFARDTRGIEDKFDDQARVCVFISPSPFGSVQKPNLGTRDEVAALIADSKLAQPMNDVLKGLTANLPLDTALIRQQSVVLRQVGPGGEPFHGLSIEYDVYGRSKISLPLRAMLTSIDEYSTMRSPECRKALLNRLAKDIDDKEQALARLSFFDIGLAWRVLAAAIAHYQRWLKPAERVFGYEIAVEAIAVRRHVPFADIPEWATHVESFGLPVTLEHRSRVPEFLNGCLYVDEPNSLWIHVCSLAGRAVGLPTEFSAHALLAAIYEASFNSR